MTDHPPRRLITDSVIARLFVVVQLALFVILFLVPGADHWAEPIWLRTLASTMVVAGVVIAAVAAFRLGPSLAAKPVPNDRGVLNTGGLYRLVRHPIYSGLLLATAGATVHSRNLVMVAVAVGLAGFFVVKADWEESRLRAHYAGYAAYAQTTPRFVPLRPIRTSAAPDAGGHAAVEDGADGGSFPEGGHATG